MNKISLPKTLTLPTQLSKDEKLEICLLHLSGVKSERRTNLFKKAIDYVTFYN